MPDFWEKQFGLNPNDAGDSAKISAGGYANIEHYFNNTGLTGGTVPIVFVATTVSRAHSGGVAGEWCFTRTGDTGTALTLNCELGGDVVAGRDFQRLSGTVTIPAGKSSATLAPTPLPAAQDGAMTVIRITTAQPGYRVGARHPHSSSSVHKPHRP